MARDLIPRILKEGIKACFGIKKLYHLQKQTINFLNSPKEVDGNALSALLGVGGDCILNAPTGYGKTLAYVIPVISDLLEIPRISWESNKVCISCVVIVPNLELVDQVLSVFDQLCRYMEKDNDIITPSVVGFKGGSKWSEEVKSLFKDDRCANIIVTTPGRFLDHLTSDALTPYLKSLRYLILDEADLLISRHLNDLSTIMESLQSAVPEGNDAIRKVLCSATLRKGSVVLGHVPLVCPRYFQFDEDPEITDIKESIRLPSRLDCFLWKVNRGTQSTIHLFEEDIRILKVRDIREMYLWHILRDFIPRWGKDEVSNDGYIHLSKTKIQRLNRIPKVMIFCDNRTNIERLIKSINQTYLLFKETLSTDKRQVNDFPDGFCRGIYPEMHSSHRQKTLELYNDKKFPVLVCTDVIGRGIDDPGIELVMSYDPPRSLTSLIHRSGRTARAGEFGSSVHLLQRKDFMRLTNEITTKAPALMEQLVNYDDVVMSSYQPLNDEIEDVQLSEQEEEEGDVHLSEQGEDGVLVEEEETV